MEINDISKFLEEEKKDFISKKIKEFKKKGFSATQAANKANQSWRSYIGRRIQDIIFKLLEKSLKPYSLKLTSDIFLKKENLPLELEAVQRKISVKYGSYLFLPDADIIVYKTLPDNDVKILAIISIKNSFRERGFETTYWKLKLLQSPFTSHIKVFLATPDKDDEIAYLTKNDKPKKMRVILEYELDGIYFLKENFEQTKKAKHFSQLLIDLLNLKN